MKINLTEIPEEGRSYLWSSQSGELSAALHDLIGTMNHEAEFFIKPLNSKDFQLTGKIKANTPEICARCGIDIAYPVNEKFNEILIPKQDQPRGTKYAKVNHLSDLPQGMPETHEYEGNMFDMGEFVHEIVGLAAPFNPKGPEDDNGDCSICKIPVKGKSFDYDEKMATQEIKNPFASLKNIKLN